MGVSTAAPRDNNDLVSRVVQHMLEDKRAKEEIESVVFRNMDVKVATEYSMTHMAMVVRIAWKDPESSARRTMSMMIDDAASKDIGLFAQEIKTFVDNLSLKGELYFFKLDRHFKNRIEKVACGADGKVSVLFKNGHIVDGREDTLDSTEFLATCAMIYDL